VSDLVAVDPASYGRIAHPGITKGRLEDLDADGIAVLDTVAGAKGWSVGEEVRARFAETGEQRLTVAAIFSDKQQVGSSYLLGLPAHDANFTDRLDGKVLVKRAEGVSPGTARAAVERVTADYPTARLQDRSEYKRAQSAEPQGSTSWPRSPPSSRRGDEKCGTPAEGVPHGRSGWNRWIPPQLDRVRPGQPGQEYLVLQPT
jgi:hypothetical protein